MITWQNLPESLHNEGLVAQTGLQADELHEASVTYEVVHAVVDTAAGGRRSAVYAAVQNRLARHARRGVYIAEAERIRVSVRDPAHLTLARSHIRS